MQTVAFGGHAPSKPHESDQADADQSLLCFYIQEQESGCYVTSIAIALSHICKAMIDMASTTVLLAPPFVLCIAVHDIVCIAM